MVDIVGGKIVYNEMNSNSNGGTELLARRLAAGIPAEELKDFQITLSRKRNLESDKIRIFWAHDLPGDPESEFLKTDKDSYHAYVFVSNWQMQAYINAYGLPWGKCIVITNFIEPIPAHVKPIDKVNLVYFSTPHRGLQILVPVFKEIAKRFTDVHLNVYSSFGLYGWGESDKSFEPLFNEIREHPNMSYFGTVPNEEMREVLKSQHILAYPSIWAETSCLVLMEAMSAKLLCVHPNYAGLSETGGRWTYEYQWNEVPNDHARTFFQVLEVAIKIYKDMQLQSSGDITPLDIGLKQMKDYADTFYNQQTRLMQWRNFLNSMRNNIPVESRIIKPTTAEIFTYNSRRK